MKTPMQELIERLEYLIGLAEGTMYEIGLKSAKEQAEAMLEKEEKVINNAYSDGVDNGRCLYECKDYYKETFKTKEK